MADRLQACYSLPPMSSPTPFSQAVSQAATPAAAPPATDPTVFKERRRFPRELPKPDVVELNSDSAWLSFQAASEAAPEWPQN